MNFFNKAKLFDILTMHDFSSILVYSYIYVAIIFWQQEEVTSIELLWPMTNLAIFTCTIVEQDTGQMGMRTSLSAYVLLYLLLKSNNNNNNQQLLLLLLK